MMMSEQNSGLVNENVTGQQDGGITPTNEMSESVQPAENVTVQESAQMQVTENMTAQESAQMQAAGSVNGQGTQVQTAMSTPGQQNMQGAYAPDRIGCAYTTNGQYAHYQMHQDGPQAFDKKAEKAQKKAQKKQFREAKKQERRAKGGYPLGMRIASALLCGVLFAGAAYGTCYGIEYLTGTKLIINGSSGGTTLQVAPTQNVNGQSIPTQGEAQTGNLIATDTGAGNAAQGMDIRSVARSVKPAVVSVTNYYTQTVQYWMYQYEQEGEGGGSGIIVGQNDSELLICTNYHVIEHAHDLQVTFIDDTTVNAVVKGTDERNDLAVIAIPIKDISEETLSKIAIARLGNSDQLEVGEEVIAIGNALGYGQSVTNGIISALDRKIEDYESLMIQTNAAINPGNSGGALVNARGEVIGIPSAKIGGSTVEGMGYAIPISVAEPILRELMERETKTMVSEQDQGYLGVQVTDVDEQGVQLYNMPMGVYIYEVYDGYAADQAGLRRGDIITGLNGTRIESKEQLINELKYYSIGTTVTLTVCRIVNNYEIEEVPVVLGKPYEE
ncbi:MAG: trypsin-like peptidase domain-containing protein [Lachnospiraceae bacterium]|nr:trypsin-like peptidase domain-containing protein [Lachnospiraceae bacterium]MDE7239532.1 trypsin-like peptidase domain-containing protein [Lachnospiraceae bacterium]